jgi:hypothetical protein
MPKKIVIRIKDGEIKVETKGFVGKNCVKEMDDLSKITGLKLKTRKFTTEAHQIGVKERTTNGY